MFLPGVKAVKKVKEDQKLDYDVAIVVDCGDLNRIGTVRKIIDPNKMLINIDHHVTNDSFGDLNFVISKASSTAEVVYDLLRRAHVKLDKDLATLLYVGIMTDTGSFQYDNTSAYTHKIVGNLLEFDVPVNTLYQRLYETVPLTDLKYFTKIVNTFDSLFDGKVICVELKKRILNKFSAEFDLRDKIFKYLRAIKGVEVLVIFTEQEKNKTRVNLRSQGKVNVARLAAEFKGGGHRKASGCLLAHDMEISKKIILDCIRKLV